MKIKVLLIFGFLFFNYSAFAHPHLFMTTCEEFVFDGDRIEGCWIEWTFDSYFSADQDFYYDWDNNDYYDEEETKALYENAFINLRNFNFFTFVRQGNVRTSPKEIYYFSAKQNQGILTYRFYIDLSYLDGKDFYIAFYDYTFFCDIRYPENSIDFIYDTAVLNPSYQIAQNKDFPVFYDPYGGLNDNSVYDKWRPGLETYYPFEIHVKYEK